MKKIFLSMVVALCSFAANAQAYVGGSLGYASVDEKNVTTSNFTFAPEFGYKLNETWDLGIELDFSSSKTTRSDSKDVLAVAPYVRYTFANLQNVDFFLQGQVKYLDYGKDCGSGFGFSIMPGLAFNVNEKVSLVGKVGVLQYLKDSKEAGDASIFAVGVDNTNLSVGVVYNF